jgi:hypothetical protein
MLSSSAGPCNIAWHRFVFFVWPFAVRCLTCPADVWWAQLDASFEGLHPEGTQSTFAELCEKNYKLLLHENNPFLSRYCNRCIFPLIFWVRLRWRCGGFAPKIQRRWGCVVHCSRLLLYLINFCVMLQMRYAIRLDLVPVTKVRWSVISPSNLRVAQHPTAKRSREISRKYAASACLVRLLFCSDCLRLRQWCVRLRSLIFLIIRHISSSSRVVAFENRKKYMWH